MALLTILTTLSINALTSRPAEAAPAETTQAADSTDTAAPTDMEALRLTDEDFKEVADELGVEVATIKAVVEVEAGRAHRGFTAPGMPIVNFDYSMFSRFASRKGINLSKYRRSHPLVFSGSRRGSQTSVYRRVQTAKEINKTAAIEGTFWGMFQIGGFNWKKCGVESIDEFERMMSNNEHDQLELFARFIKSTGLLKHLQNKNWAAFAKGYNGSSALSRGYHTRIAAAYNRHKAKQ